MSMTLTTEGKTAGIALTVGAVVGLAAGLALGWRFYHPTKILETPAPAVRQQDGSLVLERRPEANPEPKHVLPAGSKLVRRVSVEVMPRTSGASPEAKGNPAAGKTVTVDLSLVEMSDKTQRVVASSSDGEVVGGMDIPVQPVTVPHELKWAAGPYLRIHNWGHSEGAFVDYDWKLLRFGGELGRMQMNLPNGPVTGIELTVKVGLRF